jgi:aminopeptidase N
MIPSVAPRIALLLSLVTLLHGCREPSAPPPVELGVSEVLARHRAGTLSEVRYDIALQIPEDRGVPLEGRTTITFTWSDPEAHPVVLDFKDPTERVREVRVNGAAVRWAPKDDHVVMPPDAFRTGENVVEVTYQAGDEALNRSDDFLYTLFVPDRAHFSLPVFDQPNLKGRVAWEIEVPAGWVAVANGPDLRSPGPETWGEDGPEDRRLYRFASSRPIPTYLFAFAAGRFRVEEGERGGVRMRMFHRETDPDAVVRNRTCTRRRWTGSRTTPASNTPSRSSTSCSSPRSSTGGWSIRAPSPTASRLSCSTSPPLRPTSWAGRA